MWTWHRATRAITNHATIREYQLRFFPREEFKYLYSKYPIEISVKFTNGKLSLSLFYFSFYFHSILFFYFLFLEQLGLGLIGHTVTSVTTWWCSHKTDHETWENLVEDSRTGDIIQYEHHMLASWTTHGCLG